MVKNVTKNTIISEEIEIKKGFSKLIGLIWNSKKSIYFKTRFGIHTFFLKKPISVLVLDKKGKVVFVKKEVKPNRIVVWNPFFDRVLEINVEDLIKSKTEKGDIISFKESFL